MSLIKKGRNLICGLFYVGACFYLSINYSLAVKNCFSDMFTDSLILYLVKELVCLYNRSSREVKAVAMSDRRW